MGHWPIKRKTYWALSQLRGRESKKKKKKSAEKRKSRGCQQMLPVVVRKKPKQKIPPFFRSLKNESAGEQKIKINEQGRPIKGSRWRGGGVWAWGLLNGGWGCGIGGFPHIGRMRAHFRCQSETWPWAKYIFSFFVGLHPLCGHFIYILFQYATPPPPLPSRRKKGLAVAPELG